MPAPTPETSPTPPGRAELDALARLAEGHTVDRIARDLDVSERTVRRRLRAAADHLGADSTIQAVVTAVRRGLI